MKESIISYFDKLNTYKREGIHQGSCCSFLVPSDLDGWEIQDLIDFVCQSRGKAARTSFQRLLLKAQEEMA